MYKYLNKIEKEKGKKNYQKKKNNIYKYMKHVKKNDEQINRRTEFIFTGYVKY